MAGTPAVAVWQVETMTADRPLSEHAKTTGGDLDVSVTPRFLERYERQVLLAHVQKKGRPEGRPSFTLKVRPESPVQVQ